MNICIANYDPDKIGGGWTFADNLAKGLGGSASYAKADIYLIAGASMVDRGAVQKAKDDGKKIVLRIDNHLLPSRNRNSGMQKLKDYADMADLLIYQSLWARDYLGEVLNKHGEVILNGVDLDIFLDGSNSPLRNQENYLYARSSRIAEKGWEMARFWFSQKNLADKNIFLAILGKFSRENMDYNFDFINGEKFRYYGLMNREQFALMLHNHKYFLYSYFMDACSNTLIEALACGCEIIDVYGMLKTGGAPEIMTAYAEKGRDYFSLQRMTEDYLKAMEQL